MSGLTKKTVVADRALATILSVNEGELVSYAQLSKGLHKYIKDHDLKNPQLRLAQPPAATLASLPATAATPSPSSAAPTGLKKCRDCGTEIPSEATFCDMCGVKQ